MKCSVFRCPSAAVDYFVGIRKGRLHPPEVPLCAAHGKRYAEEFHRHFSPMVARLSRRWQIARRQTLARVEAVLSEMDREMRRRSWQATWLQMVDLELLNSGEGLLVTKGRMGANGEFMADGAEVPPRPSATRLALPEHATRAGQAAIAARAADAAQVERQLAADVDAYAKGRRMELEYELREQHRQEAAARARQKAKP